MTTHDDRPSRPREDRDPEEPRPARPRDAGDAASSRTARSSSRYYVPIIYTACRTCYSEQDPGRDLPAGGRRRVRPAQDAEAHRLGHRIRARLDHRARRLHVRHQRRVADAVAPARPPPGRRGVRPAEPALRQVQGRGDDAPPLHRRGRPGPARAVRGAGRRRAGAVRRPARGRRARRGRPLRLPERDPDEPGHDDQPAGAHPHVRPAPVHDGPVGDPAALPAHPPRDLRGLAVPRLVPRARSACRSATATSSTTATATARSGRTRTGSSRPGRRRRPPRRPPVASCRSPEVRVARGAVP